MSADELDVDGPLVAPTANHRRARLDRLADKRDLIAYRETRSFRSRYRDCKSRRHTDERVVDQDLGEASDPCWRSYNWVRHELLPYTSAGNARNGRAGMPEGWAMPDGTGAETPRERILAACRNFVLRGEPMPGLEGNSRKTRNRSAKARPPVLAWLPLSVSQNRLAAVVGKTKDSEIFGGNRIWSTKAEFDDDLRMTLVNTAVHDDAFLAVPPIPDDLGTLNDADRRALLTELVRTQTADFVEVLAGSQTFLIGMSARAGIAAAPAERNASRSGSPTPLWNAVADRISTSRSHYRSIYEATANAFGLEPRRHKSMDDALDLFTAITAAAADGFGQAAPYHQQPLATDAARRTWSPLGYLVAALMNDLFVLDGAPPVFLNLTEPHRRS